MWILWNIRLAHYTIDHQLNFNLSFFVIHFALWKGEHTLDDILDALLVHSSFCIREVFRQLTVNDDLHF